MELKKKQKIFDLVRAICNSTVSLHSDKDVPPDCPTESSYSAAYDLLKTVGVSPEAVIFEIPLCWDNQVVIRFTIGEWRDKEDVVIFSLSAGVSCCDSGRFFFELQVETAFSEAFDCPPDDEVGNYLFNDEWKIDGERVKSSS